MCSILPPHTHPHTHAEILSKSLSFQELLIFALNYRCFFWCSSLCPDLKCLLLNVIEIIPDNQISFPWGKVASGKGAAIRNLLCCD